MTHVLHLKAALIGGACRDSAVVTIGTGIAAQWFTMSSPKTETIMNMLRENPDLLTNLNRALSEIFATAGVDLTAAEKKEFLQQLGDTIRSSDKGVHVHI